MKTSLTANVTVDFNATPERVWDALTNPEIIKKYFFGTETITDWKKGSAIVFKGTWEGKSYVDKGIIEDIIPGSMVRYSYWSSLSQTADVPENYAFITYQVKEKNGFTELSITQEGLESDEKKEHSEGNWKYILEEMKKIVE